MSAPNFPGVTIEPGETPGIVVPAGEAPGADQGDESAPPDELEEPPE